MNIHDEFIKKANKEIDKLTADIEKKKARITELRESIKQHELEKTRDSQFTDTLMKLMNDNGIVSDDDRKSILARFEDLMLEREIEKSENHQATEQAKKIEESKNESGPITEIPEKTVTAQNGYYQNPPYPYKPTSN